MSNRIDDVLQQLETMKLEADMAAKNGESFDATWAQAWANELIATLKGPDGEPGGDYCDGRVHIHLDYDTSNGLFNELQGEFFSVQNEVNLFGEKYRVERFDVSDRMKNDMVARAVLVPLEERT